MSVSSIMDLFAKSPLKPIEEHVQIVHSAAEQLSQFFTAVFAKDWEQAEKVRNTISELERKADGLKRQVRMQLPRGLFLPVGRTDLLELITQQDKIANRAKDIAGRVIGRELQIPEAIQSDFIDFVNRCIEATRQASEAVNEFDSLLESGFSGREVDVVEKLVANIDSIENDTDEMQVQLRRNLMKIENDLNPVDVMFLYDIFDWVGDLADHAERVGSRLEVILAR